MVEQKGVEILGSVFGTNGSLPAIGDEHIMAVLLDVGDTSKATFDELKRQIEADGLAIDHLHAGGGQALLIRLKGVEHGLLRLERDQGTDPLDHPLVLKPVLRKRYTVANAKGEPVTYVASVVPEVEPNMPCTHEAYLRSYACMEKAGLAENFADISREQLSYLKGADGKSISAGDKPVAFFHDLNSTASDPKTFPRGFGSFRQSMDATQGRIVRLRHRYEHKHKKEAISKVEELRASSEKGASLTDDAHFLNYLLSAYGSPREVFVPTDYLAAAARQRELLAALRTELEPLPLADDLKKQLHKQSRWERAAERAVERAR